MSAFSGVKENARPWGHLIILQITQEHDFWSRPCTGSSPLWAPGGPQGLPGATAATVESVQLADSVKGSGDTSGRVETRGISLRNRTLFHIIRSALCHIRVNLQRQLLGRALGLLEMYRFHEDIFFVNQRGTVDLPLRYCSTGSAVLYLPGGKQNSACIRHS